MFLNVKVSFYVYVKYKMLLLIKLVHRLIQIYPIYEVLQDMEDNLNIKESYIFIFIKN